MFKTYLVKERCFGIYGIKISDKNLCFWILFCLKFAFLSDRDFVR